MIYHFSCDIDLPMDLSDTGRERLARSLREQVLEWFEHHAYKFCYPCEEDEWLDGLGVDNAKVSE